MNQGDYLEEAIRSVLLQDYPNLEYLVIDGGSTDQSTAIIKRYEPWISRWVSEPDGGQADAINRGSNLGSGDLLCWLNADDVLFQGFISRRVQEFAELPAVDLIYGDVETGWTGETRSPLLGKPSIFLEMLRTLRVEIPQQSAMWRRSTIQRLGGLDSRWQVVLDREFFLRIIRLGTARYSPGCCGYFRQHRDAKSVARATAWAVELPSMYKELFADPALDPGAKALERETMANVHLMCADVLRAARNWSGCLAHWTKAISWSPAHAIATFTAARTRGVVRRLTADRGGLGTRRKPTR